MEPPQIVAPQTGQRHWQTLNALEPGPLSKVALVEALQPFWGEGKIALEDVLQDLANRGWVAPLAGDQVTLTSAGQLAHAAVAERVHTARRLMLTGLSPEQYRTTVNMPCMAGNLEAALKA